jgi:hypothetical protein
MKEACPNGRRCGAALEEVRAAEPQVRGAEEVQRIRHRGKRRAGWKFLPRKRRAGGGQQ